MTNSTADDPFTVLLRLEAATKLGVVPLLSPWDVFRDVGRALASLPPDEARRLRRKFRKVWRQEIKRTARVLGERRLEVAGLGSREPTRKQKLERKWAVFSRIMQDEWAARR
jgi:hypothetical protein